MHFKISKEISQELPGIYAAVITVKNVSNTRFNTALTQLMNGAFTAKKNYFYDPAKQKQFNKYISAVSFQGKAIPQVRRLESLVKRAISGQVPKINDNLSAIAQFFSIKNFIPIDAEDLDEIDSDIILEFEEITKGKKTKGINLSKDTKNVAVWIINMGAQQKEEFDNLSYELAELINKYCGGEEPEINFVSAENPEIDLNYESEKEKNKTREPEKQEEETSAEQKQPEIILKEQLGARLLATVNAYLGEKGQPADKLLPVVELDTPADPEHGAYATNIAMKLADQLSETPEKIAREIKSRIPQLEYLEKIEVAPPGFINFFLSKEFLQKRLDRILQLKDSYGRLSIGAGKKVVIDFSSPNIAKPLGVHHLLSTIIGQVIANLYEIGGYEVIKVNYLGDWGTQFGKIIYAFKTWGDKETIQNDPLNELLKLYVKFHNEAENDPVLEEKGREEFKKLEEGDEENLQLWEWIRDISIKEDERIYNKLGVKFDEYLGEKMYLQRSKEIIREGKEKGVFEEGENGSVIVKFENDKYPPYLVQKADGTTLYSTRDIASIEDRIARFSPRKIIYVVDVAQSLHFNQLFDTAQRLGYKNTELVHVSFGRMQLPESKMSTRTGDVVLLNEVIKEGVTRTQRLVEEKGHDLSEEEKKNISEKMAVSAIKYNILSQNRETNMTFDWDKMLTLEGNSGPYLQYAYARAKSILRKLQEPAEKQEEKIIKANENQTSLFSIAEEQKESLKPFEHKSSETLLRLAARYPEIIQSAIYAYKPNILSGYLFELARSFNSFYNEVSVINTKRPDLKEARTKLVKAVAQILKNGMAVLGIDVFERM
jgi:arginyl-tRNA synthetase